MVVHGAYAKEEKRGKRSSKTSMKVVKNFLSQGIIGPGNKFDMAVFIGSVQAEADGIADAAALSTLTKFACSNFWRFER